MRAVVLVVLFSLIAVAAADLCNPCQNFVGGLQRALATDLSVAQKLLDPQYTCPAYFANHPICYSLLSHISSQRLDSAISFLSSHDSKAVCTALRLCNDPSFLATSPVQLDQQVPNMPHEFTADTTLASPFGSQSGKFYFSEARKASLAVTDDGFRKVTDLTRFDIGAKFINTCQFGSCKCVALSAYNVVVPMWILKDFCSFVAMEGGNQHWKCTVSGATQEIYVNRNNQLAKIDTGFGMGAITFSNVQNSVPADTTLFAIPANCPPPPPPANLDCRTSPIDIVLVVDGSGSIVQEDFFKVRNALVDFAKDYIPEHAIRVGIVQFGSTVSTVQQLSNSATQVTNSAQNLFQIYGGTNTAGGLNAAFNMLKQSSTKYKAIVLLTDGKHSPETADPIAAAEAIKNTGIKISVVAVGNDVDSDEIEAIAGSLLQTTHLPSMDSLSAWTLFSEVCAI